MAADVRHVSRGVVIEEGLRAVRERGAKAGGGGKGSSRRRCRRGKLTFLQLLDELSGKGEEGRKSSAPTRSLPLHRAAARTTVS